MIEGYDQTYAQKIYANSSYIHDEICWNPRFKPMLREDKGGIILELD